MHKNAQPMTSLSATSAPLKKEQLPELLAQWTKLEKISSKSFFTSWKWIGSWLKMLDYKTNVVTVFDHDEVVGLAFFNILNANRPFHVSAQLWFNRTGEDAKDQIWPEYNDILCARGREWAIRAVVLQHLADKYPQLDEFILGVSRDEIFETPTPRTLFPRIIWETQSYASLLSDTFSDLDVYLSTLSRNTRHQIRRTLKLLGQRGEVKLVKAQTSDDALEMLECAAQLHRQRWPGLKSGFNNPYFQRFHHELIKRNYSSGCIDLLCLQVNESPLCYLYNFNYDGYVYFYLSGIEYEQDNRLKPGLLAHAMAISHYASKGCHTYDFMGGQGQYKASLSNHQEPLIITSFQKKQPLFILKHWLDNAKSYLTSSGNLLNDRE
ncbi:hypothetical protein BK026_08335 [Alteromonas sp. V450]|uniref:GNAT family N-acetyltransferase n=1 Tax=Alteromonas sp. V450 TaxID=1912139 RepID=UPI0008FF191D|nr:GNAT family N-acetyltransferase [Alteromonas sp. V450]OJF68795.1 hypothetical protein BK026_08335 [Alteromonas sp. V450]